MHGALYIFIAAMLAVLTTSSPEQPAGFTPTGDTFARIESGQTTVVQNGFSISFFDEHSALRRLELRSPFVIRPGKCSFSNRFIFMPDIGFGIVRAGGRWQPAGCAIFERSGKTVREFSAAAGAFAENNSAKAGYFRAETVFFIDTNTVAIKTEQGVFLYDILRDTTVLKKCGGCRPEHAPGADEHGAAAVEHGFASDEHAPAAESRPPEENEHGIFGDEHGALGGGSDFGGDFGGGESRPAGSGKSEK